jgi:glucose-1-phosphatase
MENKVILFDLGGVLVELTGVRKMMKWLPKQVTEDELWEIWLTSDAVRKFETGKCEPNEFAEEIIAEMKLAVLPDEFLKHFESWVSGTYTGVHTLLKTLKKDYTIALLSNTNIIHWNKVIKEMEIAELFDHLFLSFETRMLKPDKETFSFILKEMKCEPADVIFLDDNIINVRSARFAGITSYTAKGLNQAESILENIGIL